MDALIMSCSTGGGHNAAGYAVKEELERRGHRVTMLDPYALVGKKVVDAVGNGYVRIAQKTPHLFGCIYQLGNWYRRLPIHSPVYLANKAVRKQMQAHLEANHYDVVLLPHIYPGEILAYLKSKGFAIPKTVFIATDYTCIPFAEEADCDYYMIPSEELTPEFTRFGIAPEKLVPTGIPVSHAFREELSREDAIYALGLARDKRYLVLSGGSIGAGAIRKTIRILRKYLQARPDYQLIVICGNHSKLLKKLKAKYGADPQITLLASTDRMALYMKACDAFLTKPGGLSSTEAAVARVPLIHVAPIPGCESRNLEYFRRHGLSIAVGSHTRRLESALAQMQDAEFVSRMRERQAACINPAAADEICDLAEKLAAGVL